MTYNGDAFEIRWEVVHPDESEERIDTHYRQKWLAEYFVRRPDVKAFLTQYKIPHRLDLMLVGTDHMGDPLVSIWLVIEDEVKAIHFKLWYVRDKVNYSNNWQDKGNRRSIPMGVTVAGNIRWRKG